MAETGEASAVILPLLRHVYHISLTERAGDSPQICPLVILLHPADALQLAPSVALAEVLRVLRDRGAGILPRLTSSGVLGQPGDASSGQQVLLYHGDLTTVSFATDTAESAFRYTVAVRRAAPLPPASPGAVLRGAVFDAPSVTPWSLVASVELKAAHAARRRAAAVAADPGLANFLPLPTIPIAAVGRVEQSAAATMNVNVVARLQPSSSADPGTGTVALSARTRAVTYLGDYSAVGSRPGGAAGGSHYFLDGVLGPKATAEDVFTAAVAPLVDDVSRGGSYAALLSCGGGRPSPSSSSSSPPSPTVLEDLIPVVAAQLFRALAARQSAAASALAAAAGMPADSTTSSRLHARGSFRVSVTCVEVGVEAAAEDVLDLLSDSPVLLHPLEGPPSTIMGSPSGRQKLAPRSATRDGASCDDDDRPSLTAGRPASSTAGIATAETETEAAPALSSPRRCGDPAAAGMVEGSTASFASLSGGSSATATSSLVTRRSEEEASGSAEWPPPPGQGGTAAAAAAAAASPGGGLGVASPALSTYAASVLSVDGRGPFSPPDAACSQLLLDSGPVVSNFSVIPGAISAAVSSSDALVSTVLRALRNRARAAAERPPARSHAIVFIALQQESHHAPGCPAFEAALRAPEARNPVAASTPRGAAAQEGRCVCASPARVLTSELALVDFAGDLPTAHGSGSKSSVDISSAQICSPLHAFFSHFSSSLRPPDTSLGMGAALGSSELPPAPPTGTQSSLKSLLSGTPAMRITPEPDSSSIAPPPIGMSPVLPARTTKLQKGGTVPSPQRLSAASKSVAARSAAPSGRTAAAPAGKAAVAGAPKDGRVSLSGSKGARPSATHDPKSSATAASSAARQSTKQVTGIVSAGRGRGKERGAPLGSYGASGGSGSDGTVKGTAGDLTPRRKAPQKPQDSSPGSPPPPPTLPLTHSEAPRSCGEDLPPQLPPSVRPRAAGSAAVGRLALGPPVAKDRSYERAAGEMSPRSAPVRPPSAGAAAAAAGAHTPASVVPLPLHKLIGSGIAKSATFAAAPRARPVSARASGGVEGGSERRVVLVGGRASAAAAREEGASAVATGADSLNAPSSTDGPIVSCATSHADGAGPMQPLLLLQRLGGRGRRWSDPSSAALFSDSRSKASLSPTGRRAATADALLLPSDAEAAGRSAGRLAPAPAAAAKAPPPIPSATRLTWILRKHLPPSSESAGSVPGIRQSTVVLLTLSPDARDAAQTLALLQLGADILRTRSQTRSSAAAPSTPQQATAHQLRVQGGVAAAAGAEAAALTGPSAAEQLVPAAAPAAATPVDALLTSLMSQDLSSPPSDSELAAAAAARYPLSAPLLPTQSALQIASGLQPTAALLASLSVASAVTPRIYGGGDAEVSKESPGRPAVPPLSAHTTTSSSLSSPHRQQQHIPCTCDDCAQAAARTEALVEALQQRDSVIENLIESVTRLRRTMRISSDLAATAAAAAAHADIHSPRSSARIARSPRLLQQQPSSTSSRSSGAGAAASPSRAKNSFSFDFVGDTAVRSTTGSEGGAAGASGTGDAAEKGSAHSSGNRYTLRATVRAVSLMRSRLGRRLDLAVTPASVSGSAQSTPRGPVSAAVAVAVSIGEPLDAASADGPAPQAESELEDDAALMFSPRRSGRSASGRRVGGGGGDDAALQAIPGAAPPRAASPGPPPPPRAALRGSRGSASSGVGSTSKSSHSNSSGSSSSVAVVSWLPLAEPLASPRKLGPGLAATPGSARSLSLQQLQPSPPARASGPATAGAPPSPSQPQPGFWDAGVWIPAGSASAFLESASAAALTSVLPSARTPLASIEPAVIGTAAAAASARASTGASARASAEGAGSDDDDLLQQSAVGDAFRAGALASPEGSGGGAQQPSRGWWATVTEEGGGDVEMVTALTRSGAVSPSTSPTSPRHHPPVVTTVDLDETPLPTDTSPAAASAALHPAWPVSPSGPSRAVRRAVRGPRRVSIGGGAAAAAAAAASKSPSSLASPSAVAVARATPGTPLSPLQPDPAASAAAAAAAAFATQAALVASATGLAPSAARGAPSRSSADSRGSKRALRPKPPPPPSSEEWARAVAASDAATTAAAVRPPVPLREGGWVTPDAASPAPSAAASPAPSASTAAAGGGGVRGADEEGGYDDDGAASIGSACTADIVQDIMFDSEAAADWVRTLRKAVLSAHTSLQRYSASPGSGGKRRGLATEGGRVAGEWVEGGKTVGSGGAQLGSAGSSRGGGAPSATGAGTPRPAPPAGSAGAAAQPEGRRALLFSAPPSPLPTGSPTGTDSLSSPRRGAQETAAALPAQDSVTTQ